VLKVPKSCVDACSEFLITVSHAHIISALFQMETMESQPGIVDISVSSLPPEEKKRVLLHLSKMIADSHVCFSFNQTLTNSENTQDKVYTYACEVLSVFVLHGIH
jgi:hypothetical protein